MRLARAVDVSDGERDTAISGTGSIRGPNDCPGIVESKTAASWTDIIISRSIRNDQILPVIESQQHLC